MALVVASVESHADVGTSKLRRKMIGCTSKFWLNIKVQNLKCKLVENQRRNWLKVNHMDFLKG